MNVRTFRSRLVVASLVLAPLLVGCSRGPAIVGKWKGTQAQGSGSVTVEATFVKDGRYTVVTEAKGGAVSMNITQSGTYTVKEDTLSTTPVSLTVNGKPMPSGGTTPRDQKFRVEGNTLTLGEGKPGQGLALTKVP